MQLGDRKVSHLFTDNICLKLLYIFSLNIFTDNACLIFFFRDRNNELVKKSRRKQKEKERVVAAAIEAGEKELKKIEEELGVLKKYMAIHNALQDNPAMFELVKNKLQERNVI